MSPASRERARDRLIREITEQVGPVAVVLLDSGTTALSLALRHLVSNRGACFLALPAYGCFDLATAADAIGGRFVLYDMDPATLSPDLDSVRRALERGADRIVVAHLYGLPADINAVRSLATQYGALVIDDAAQALGASLHGRPVGALGDAGVLSFGRGKGFTGGSGGALLLPTGGLGGVPVPAFDVSPASAAEVVQAVAQVTLGRPELYWVPASLPFLGLGETVYRQPHAPRGISSFALGVLRDTRRFLADELQARRHTARRLRDALTDSLLRPMNMLPGATPSFLRYPVLAADATARIEYARSGKRLGVMPGYPRALADLAGFGHRRENTGDSFLGARALAERLLTLPTHGAMTESDLLALIAWARGH